MRQRLGRALVWHRTETGGRMVRFSMVSLISTLVSLSVLEVTFGILHWFSAPRCALLANVVATVPSYILNRRWAWKKAGKSHFWREVVPFWSMSVTGILFSILCVYIAGWGSNHLHLTAFHKSIAVDIANVFAFGVLWILKFLFFNRLFAVVAEHEVADADELLEV